MDSISDLATTLQFLQSDKVTERKKACEKLRNLLSMQAVCMLLTENGFKVQRGGKRLLSWDILLKAVISYVRHETDVLRRVKEDIASAACLSARDKRKQEISALFKHLVRSCEKSGGDMRGNLLMGHIMEVMREEFTCSAFGTDYSNILLKNVLCAGRKWIEISSTRWHDLLNIYCRLFLNPKSGIDRSIVARLIEIIIQGMALQCDLNHKTTITFFTEAFHDVREIRGASLLEPIVVALGIFTAKAASDCRMQICILGEKILPDLLYLWTNCSSDKVKMAVVHFFTQQMQVHHPQGAKTTQDGAIAADFLKWRSHLHHLYEALYSDIRQRGGRQQILSDARSIVMKEVYIKLFADICNQLFTGKCEVRDTSMIGIEEQSFEERKVKRQRLMPDWSSLLDVIVTEANSLLMIPWIQLMVSLLDKYPECVEKLNSVTLLQCLQRTLAECKLNEIYIYIINCLTSLAKCCSRCKLSHDIKMSLNSEWQKVWFSTLGLVSSRHSVTYGYHTCGFILLSTLLQGSLVKADRQVWNLFQAEVTLPSLSSVGFLSELLVVCPLPEDFLPTIAGCISTTKGGFALRKHLISWVFLYIDDPNNELSSSSLPLQGCDVARIIFQLVMRDPALVSTIGRNVTFQDSWSTLEKLYQLTTFDCELDIERQHDEGVMSGVGQAGGVCYVIPCLVLRFQETLERVTQHHLQPDSKSFKSLEVLAFYSSFLSHCLRLSFLHGVAMSDMLKLSLYKTLTRLAALLCDYLHSQRISCLLPVVQTIQRMILFNDSAGIASYKAAEIIRECIPEGFVKLLVDFVQREMFEKNGSHSHSAGGSNLSVNCRKAYKPENGNCSTRLIPAGDDIELDFGEFCDNTDTVTCIFNRQSDSVACKRLLDPQHLLDSHSISKTILNFLCCLGSFDSCCAPGTVLPSDFDITNLKLLVQGVWRDDNFDCSHPAHVQSMKETVELLLSVGHHVTSIDMENILNVLRRVAQANRCDQEVCSMVLSLVCEVVPHMSKLGDAQSKTFIDCCDSVLHLVSAFWQLQSDGNYNSDVRLCLARCMAVIIQYDPDGEWGELKVGQHQSQVAEDKAENRTVSHYFPLFLNDLSLCVRVEATNFVTRLFVKIIGGHRVPICSKVQHILFDRIYGICNQNMETQAAESPSGSEFDAWTSQVSVMLLMLARVGMASVVCEKKALFALCQVIQEKSVDIVLVSKIVQKMNQSFCYKSSGAYIAGHLPFLINQWLDLDHQLRSFPFFLLQSDCLQHFYSTHYKVLVPQLVMRGHTDTLNSIAQCLNQSVDALLEGCLPSILVNILPVFAVSKMDSTVSFSLSDTVRCSAQRGFSFLVGRLGKETIDKTISSQLDIVVANILGCLTLDSKRHSQQSGGGLPSNPPSYSEEIVKVTLHYLAHSFSGSNRSLISVLAKTPDGLEQLLLSLSLAIWQEVRPHERLRRLQMFRIVITMVFQDLAETQLGGAWAFLIRRTVTILLQQLPPMHLVGLNDFGYREEIMIASLGMLKQACSVVIETCHEELRNYLSIIVDVSCPLAERGGAVGDAAKDLLGYLLLENQSVVNPLLVKLDPLPKHGVVGAMAKHCDSVQSQAERDSSFSQLVDRVIDNTDGPAPRTLRKLCSRISQQRSVMNLLSNDRQSGFRVSQLVCQLLHLTQSSVDAVVEESSRFLGSIGPVDLSYLAFPSSRLNVGLEQSIAEYKGGQYEKYCNVFHLLHQYLFDPNVALVEVASQVLKRALATPEGSQFSADYKDRLKDKDYLFQYLFPFRSNKHSKLTSPDSVQQSQSMPSILSDDNLWQPKHADHSRWITDLCVALIGSRSLSDSILQLLRPVCLLKAEFCDMLLPFLIHDILQSGRTDCTQLLSKRVAGFFSQHCQQTVHSTFYADGEKCAASVCTNKRSVLALLKVINYLRMQKIAAQREGDVVTPWSSYFWLDLNYLHVAWAAHHCAAHFSAVLFGEVWWGVTREGKSASSGVTNYTEVTNTSAGSECCGDDLSCSQNGLQKLLLEAHRCIGDPDAIYGCGVCSVPDSTSRVETYQYEKKWEKAVVTLDIQMQRPSESIQFKLFRAVQRTGANYMLGRCLGCPATCADITELQYEAAWRAGRWDLDVPLMRGSSAPLHQTLYTCLHFVREGQPSVASGIVKKCRSFLLQGLDIDVECFRSMQPLLSNLQCVRQIEFLLDAYSRLETGEEKLLSLLTDWAQLDLSADMEFLEPVYSLRVSGVRLLLDRVISPDISAALHEVLLVTAKSARVSGYYQLAERYLNEFEHLSNVNACTRLRAQLQLGQLLWARNEQTTAKHVLKMLIHQCQENSKEDNKIFKLLSKSLTLYGNWLAETHSDAPSIIMEQYLQKAVGMLENSDDKPGHNAVEAYFSLAWFADTQYQNIVNHMSSPLFEAKGELMRKATAECQKYRHTGHKDKYLLILERQSKIDQQELNATADDRHNFLLHAMRCYSNCLLYGDKHDLRIFRLASLWFDNSSNMDVSNIMNDCASRINTFKFLPLIYQLAARMSNRSRDGATFLPILNNLLDKMVLEHPYQTLWVILALAHADKDDEMAEQGLSTRRTGRSFVNKADPNSDVQDRVMAANELLQRVTRLERLGEIVRNMKLLSDAYLQLANWNVKQYSKERKPISMPKSLKLTAITDMTNVAVPSIEVQVDRSCEYRNIVSIVGFTPTFRLVGGINLPRIVTCRSSDGVDRQQLVKGRDDLRQDAIMQQTFGLVNQLLDRDPTSNCRQLYIRTYKVVPLSRRSGLLEWCEGTQPLGEYLVGQGGCRPTGGAHHFYRPNDWLFLECRKHMMSVASNPSPATKYNAYMKVCENFQPVFRHFFLENFQEAADWFQCRLAYTRSVATNSIVGYILGLGDRHVMNILIDRHTAELIHIDLGIAFEQGHILPTPETVPFRLTRDVVDGMGVMGVEGVFRRCCEKTMEVMRLHQDSLITVIQVLLFDPLSDWTLSPRQVYSLQGRRDRDNTDMTNLTVNTMATDVEMDDAVKSGDGAEQGNKLAKRALIRVRHKLQGLEDGMSLSVEGQVNHLIQVARDPHNLCRLYSGWQPYI